MGWRRVLIVLLLTNTCLGDEFCVIQPHTLQQARTAMLAEAVHPIDCERDMEYIYEQLTRNCSRSYMYHLQRARYRCLHGTECERRADMLKSYGYFRRELYSCGADTPPLMRFGIGPLST